VLGLGLKQLQDALNRKADEIQREFVAMSDELDDIGKQILQARGEETKDLRARQLELRQRQQELADVVNVWRERSRAVLTQRGAMSLRAYLDELEALNEEGLKAAIQHVRFILDAPEEELAKLAQGDTKREATTPAGRLIERARTSYEMRTGDYAYRQRTAVEFANRPGMAQDDAALQELQTFLEDTDPIVREIALLTTFQIHRFRAMRLADLQKAHESVEYLAQASHPSLIPILIEVLEKPRTGFYQSDEGAVEKDNRESRLRALQRLAELHTADAQAAIRARLFDRDSRIVNAASEILNQDPGVWKGPSTAKPPS
jgi:hypothetical protein